MDQSAKNLVREQNPPIRRNDNYPLVKGGKNRRK
jgi:hypothetical protein